MKAKCVSLLLLFFFSLCTHAQVIVETKPVMDKSKIAGSASKSQIIATPLFGEAKTESADLKWRPSLVNKCIAREPKVPNYELIEKMKVDKMILKKESMTRKNGNSEQGTQSVTPVVGASYLGNLNNSLSPLDNSMAISNGNWIVSVANATIEYDYNGNTYYYQNITSFLNDPDITNVCDPVVIYDAGMDRFIFFVQECSSNSSNSFIFLCFSKTNDPNDGWWIYKITGNPLNDDSWFDYPKLAVSTNEAYVSGNLFDNSGNFNQAILFQLDKFAGYAGQVLNWQIWFGISGNPFTLLPVSWGQGGSYGPGCYLVATNSSGNSTIQLYDLTEDMSGSPSLDLYNVSTDSYSPAADAAQLGTTVLLDNGDCRALSGFYLDGIIHFVFHSDYGNGWNGINYNRLSVSSLTNESSMFGLSGSYDYSYPTVVSYATTTTDKSVMIGFGRSSSTIYPQERVVNCDDAMNWSNSTLVKSGSGFVSYTGNPERWGDYTGSSRKHNQAPRIWMTGSFGTTSNVWNAWNAEIYDPFIATAETTMPNKGVKVFPNPVIETFSVEFNLDNAEYIDIDIIDANGKIVKDIYNGKANSGINAFTFNKTNLSGGTYYLIIHGETTIIKNEKIIIAD